MAGVKKWVKSGFLNKDIKLPLGTIWAMRTQIEADLLLQNLMLTADAMGLGAWIHASIAPPVLLGDPKFRKRYGPMLDFDWTRSALEAGRTSCAGTSRCRSTPSVRATTVGLRHKGEHLIKAMCPPNYDTMADAVDAVVADKFGPDGIYTRRGAVRAHLPRRVRRDVSRGGQQLRRRRDRLHARHLHLHLRDPRPVPRALRHDPRARRLAPDPSRRERLLREVLPQRADRRASSSTTSAGIGGSRRPAPVSSHSSCAVLNSSSDAASASSRWASDVVPTTGST